MLRKSVESFHAHSHLPFYVCILIFHRTYGKMDDVLYILGSGLSDLYDPLRYNSPELNAESLYSDQPHSRRKRVC